MLILAQPHYHWEKKSQYHETKKRNHTKLCEGEALASWPTRRSIYGIRYDIYGFPTLESRLEQREELSKLAVCVKARVPGWIYKAKIKEAKAHVCRLRGDRSGQNYDDLGILLEFCAHASAKKSSYRTELDRVTRWLIKEAKQVHHPAILSVREEDDEDSMDAPQVSPDTKMKTFYPEEENKSETSLHYQRRREDLARLLCDFALQHQDANKMHTKTPPPAVVMICD